MLEANDVLRPIARSPTTTSRDYFGHFYEFVLDDREFTSTPEYASETVRMYFDATARTRTSRRRRTCRPRS